MAGLYANHCNCFANSDRVLGRDWDFTSHSGISTNVCSVIWNLCDFPSGTAELIHLLWAFLFLKVYATEPALIAIVRGSTWKRFRKCVWTVIEEVAANAPSVVSCWCCLIIKKNILIEWLSICFSFFLQFRWENRFHRDQGKTCKVTADGTNFPIQEHTPFNRE